MEISSHRQLGLFEIRHMLSFLGDVCRVSNSYETRSNKGKQRLGSGHSHPAQQSTEADKGGDHCLAYSKSSSTEKCISLEFNFHLRS